RKGRGPLERPHPRAVAIDRCRRPRIATVPRFTLLSSPLILATANPHKVAELREIFAQAGVEVVGLDEAAGGGELQEPAEIGSTFEENAAIKARSYAAQLGRACLADDSGLEIDALAGAPGVISSHYSTDGQERGLSRAERDAANNERVL